ncbi:MAG: tryptophan synthase subunit beta [Bacteroidales bacterium]|nr:tryptophan synthase subunit beta [Bacteroidales bacterium]
MNTKIDNLLVRPNEKMLKYDGRYGEYGGSYVPEVLQSRLDKLAEVFERFSRDEEFLSELEYYLTTYAGRPSPIYYARRLSEYVGSRIFLKREDLNHTGSHKINNTLGQGLLAKRMNAKELVAETGAGQHGVATATVAALLGIPCKIFMGSIDYERQSLNVKRMELLGTEVIRVDRGYQGLKDAVDAAIEYYFEHPEAFYVLGSQVGPHPYPKMVGFFQSVIGQEAREQILSKIGKLPDAVVASAGGGSNAIGIFSAFLDDERVSLYGAEGGGLDISGKTAATLTYGKPIVFQGFYSYCLVDENNNPVPSYSIAAGLDYPGISPQHAYLKDTGRVVYFSITDAEAIEAFKLLSKLEGITPAIESSHALALVIKLFKNADKTILVNLSGRGDKDVSRI